MDSQHVVLVIGGGISGAEAAFQFARRGIRCVVIDQNERPYGKIEDGLPRWHVNLRLQEMRKIDEKLSRPEIHFVPRTKLGQDVSLAEFLSWGASAVVLAVGAWRDRPLPLSGIDRYVGRGLAYQNPFVYWFNHYPERDYRGPRFEISDDALVIGGGLASLDVVKILMLETVTRALADRGQETDLYDLERLGIARVLGERGLTLADLGLRGCTLVYRRQVDEMPVVNPPEDATPEQIERTRATRRKLLQKFSEKYLFHFRGQCTPVGYLTDVDSLKGLRLAATEQRRGKVVPVKGAEEVVPSRLVVSSIGSIPEPIEGIPIRGEVYHVRDPRTGELEGMEGIFAVGNAVTGKGNIAVSQKHGRIVSQHVLENYLKGSSSGYEEVLDGSEAEAGSRASAVADILAGRSLLSGERVARILERVRDLQGRAGYRGNYREYIAAVAAS